MTYKGSDAASTDGGLEVTLQLLLDGAGGVKALGQKDDGVDEEEGGDAVDYVLKDLDPEQTDRLKEHSTDFPVCFQVLWSCTAHVCLQGAL